MLTDDEVEIGVIGHAIAFVRRPHDLAGAAARIPAAAHIGRHVREQQIVIARVPDRAFGEGEARPRLPDRRVLVDQFLEVLTDHRVGHGASAIRPETSFASARTA
jgi:hypothetical protein